MSNIARNASELLVEPEDFPQSAPPSIIDDSNENLGCGRNTATRGSRAHHVERGVDGSQWLRVAMGCEAVAIL